MNTRAYEHTKFFVEECGQRLAGTPEVLKASDYILDYYNKHEIKSETFAFEVPVCTVTKSVLQVKRDGRWEDLKHTPALFCGQTPVGGLDLPLVYVENGSIANFEAIDVKNKCVLICRDVYMEYPDINMYKRLAENGAVAVIYTTNDGHWDVPYVYANYETMEEAYTIPTAIIHWNTALEILTNGLNEIHMEISFDIKNGTTRNTIGIVEGTDKSEENIIVSAHLDSAMSSVGATDDVAGVAMVMELARYYNERAKAGNPPKRTIRFIAWSGHECGLHGSKKYLLGNPEVRNSTKFVLNYDIVGNLLCNYSAIGAFAPSVEEALNGITSRLKLDWPLIQGPMVCDTLNFAKDQIPHFTLSAGFFCGNHTVYDELKLIAPEGFINPLKFSQAVIDWASEADEMEQGFSDEMNGALQAMGEMYGWGLYDE